MQAAVDATAELAKGDPSARWVVIILSAGDLLAHRVDGGWQLTGEWFPASGCVHASWGMLGFPVAEGESARASYR